MSLPLLLGAAWHLADSGAVVSRPRAWAQAADLLRNRDCAGALSAVDALAANAAGQDAVFARLAGGFYARSCGRADLAEVRLRAIEAPGGLLEDWRLWELAQAATQVGHTSAAETVLARLIGDYPASPLRPRALLAAAQLARDRGDARGALSLADLGRRTPIGSGAATTGSASEPGKVAADAATLADLEGLAWQVATAAGDAAERARSARRLLVEFPLRASDLSVIESFRAPDGRIDWTAILSGAELERRARTLLGLGLLDGATTALAAVPWAEHDFDWSLLEAEADTRAFRGAEAYAALAPLAFHNPAEEAALEWARARAADDAATVRRGRPGPNLAERTELRQRQRRHLLRVVQLASEPSLSQRALKVLFEQFVGEESTDRALACLRELRKLDPNDTTGATLLWGRGWLEYARANYTGAIGWWTELVSIYPSETSARSARYWTARSFERLGETERSRQIYREVAGADTADFYRRNALTRLGQKSLPKDPAAPPSAGVSPGLWPSDPTLSRARLLSDYGLDDLAATELDLVSDRAPKRPLAALRAVILARQGDRRKSVLAIREAFPALGGPFQASVPLEAQQLYYPVAFQPQIEAWALTHRLPVDVVYGMIRQESSFDLSAQSHVGARGLMQLMPATAREISKRFGIPFSAAGLDEPDLNVRLGTAYFRQMLDTFGGNLELALAGYNAGPNRIRRLWQNAPAQETDAFVEGLALSEPRIYVKRILILSDSYRRLYSSANAG
ncbi:MAG TPA: transglycosylase SLT domain-containing protein [Thermoanaerobaculia bacterium]|nr:transglycosylase SLT domain-containing protein [Thermoanaerobaculia bacterium]